MFDINNPNIPLMSDEGIEKIMLLYSDLYSQGLYYLPSQKYVANLIQLSTDYKPTENNKDEYEDNKNKYCIEIIFSLLNAMKEDIANYGLEDYIERIKKQSNSSEIIKYLNYSEIYNALNCEKQMVEEYINTGRIKELPSLLQYLYNKNIFCETHVGDIDEIPYVTSKETYDIEQREQGRNSFRVYINNPVGKSGLDFYLIFVNKLIEKRIPYNNKFNWHCEEERKDKSIFYFPSDYLNDVTQIMDEIYIEYPELISKFGTPPTACAQSSYYGVSHTGAGFVIKNRTYNMLINDVTSTSFFIYFCKQLKMHGSVLSKMTEEEKNIIKKYSQGVSNPDLFKEIISPANVDIELHRYETSMIQSIISKYSNQFKIAIQPKDYKNILKQVVSVRMYGDLEHVDYPICFNESFYGERTSSKKL